MLVGHAAACTSTRLVKVQCFLDAPIAPIPDAAGAISPITDIKGAAKLLQFTGTLKAPSLHSCQK